LGFTLWDWMGLLIIPFVLAILAYMFRRIESGREEEHKKLERELEQDRQREAALQKYLDQMKDLLLEKHLLKSKPQDGVRAVARTLTVVTMRRLDRRRNETLLRFLDEAGVTKKDKPVIHFEKADLSKIDLNQTVLPALDLSKADLREANLSRARLREANLTETILYWANLTETNLNEANLTEAKLRKANLTEATLYRANLTEANLIEADLRGALLAGADLRRADLTGARYNDATKWPEDFNPEEAGAIEVGV
jgi:uncharacterized protein YjbI with pentapeptide repeats